MNNLISDSFVHGSGFKLGSFCILESDVVVGNDVTIRNYVELRKGTRIGNNCYIDSGVKSSGLNKIGDNVTIRYDSIIARNVEIGNNVFISPQVMFINIPFGRKKRGWTVVSDDVKIGTNATIGDGIFIGSDITIGAKSYVNKDLIESGVYIGTPAKLRITTKGNLI